MKSHIVECFGVYNSDGQGYNSGPPISIWPIKAAAEAGGTGGYYQNVYAVKILKIEDLNYIVEKEISNITGKIPAYIPSVIFIDHVYENGFDSSKYYFSEADLLNLFKDGKYHNIKQLNCIFDGEKHFILTYPTPFKIEKIVLSRELAVKHALSKLTQEEKDLLGL